MKRVVTGLVCALVFATGCKKEAPAAPAEPKGPVAVLREVPEASNDKVVDEILDDAPTAPTVSPEQVKRYVAYRQKVLERLRSLVPAPDAGSPKQLDVRVAAAVRAQDNTRAFNDQMRDAESAVRNELGVTRDEVVNVGRVVADVLAQRQIWRMSGGDAALEKAREALKTLAGAERAEAEKRLAANEVAFAEVREAKRARERFGDPAVDAVLEHEESLWKVQQETSRLTAEIY